MDVLNLLRSRTPWGFRGGPSEMNQELQEVQKPSEEREPCLLREDSFSTDSRDQAPIIRSQSMEREPLSACVVNHPRFGAFYSLREDDSGTQSDCGSVKGPRAAPSENTAPILNNQSEQEDSEMEEESNCSSLRIANRLLPSEMHASTPISVQNALYETESEDGHEPARHLSVSSPLTSFSPPPSQAIDRDSFSPYPKIVSVASSEAPSKTKDAHLRTIRAAASEAERDDTGLARVMSPQQTARKERLRKKKEAADKIQEEMQEVGVLMEALLAQNPALQSPGPPVDCSELDSLRSRCRQQEEELLMLRTRLDDTQAQCCAAQERCSLMERKKQQMQSQVATLKWQLNLQEEFRFLTPPPNLSTQEQELWRKKLLTEKLVLAADKTWPSTGPVRKLALDEAEGAHEASPISSSMSAAYLAAVKNARRNPTPEKLALAAKARTELGLFLGGSKTGPYARSDSLAEVQLKIRSENQGRETCEMHSPRSLIRNLSASAEFVTRDASQGGPVLATEFFAPDIADLPHASIHTPLDRGNAAVAVPIAIPPLLCLATPEEAS